ncbi:cyclic peptide export ABC transporter [Spongiimicrobium salis]|uniref:cyclic peptide export ABC transporter n=1 Tax=Spongiimicrobium salis TaxID=1667022 RepID=UPI00374D19E7
MFKIKRKDFIYLLLYAIPNTILNFGIIYIINNVLAGSEAFLKDYMIIVFSALVVYTYLLNIIFQKGLNKYTYKILYENEKKLFRQVLRAPLRRIEKFGTQRFYTAVEDLRVFSDLPFVMTNTVNSLLVLILGIVYMFTISSIAAIIVVCMIILVAACYFIIMNSMGKLVEKLRGFAEGYFSLVDDLILGFKELKLSANRRKNLMDNYLGPNRDDSENVDFRVNYVFQTISIISQYGLYMVIAVIIFVLPLFDLLEQADVIAYVVIILFISGPINSLIGMQQNYTQFAVANNRIKNFMKDFQEKEEKFPIEKESKPIMNSLKFNNICFDYDDGDNEKTFALGPIDLEVKQGEVLFIVGGNGSGKSTFINILTGLYKPSDGEIVFNGEVIANGNIDLQESIAAVFTNNYVFGNNYDNYSLVNNEDYQNLLNIMQLDKVIKDDKEESARKKFSKGQSKRISMIFALLEDKPILVLDEWAADQDPHFRKFFYEELIPKLKKEGKTIIAVTHDDAYFHLANRIVKFDFGKIVKDVQINTDESLAEVVWGK